MAEGRANPLIIGALAAGAYYLITRPPVPPPPGGQPPPLASCRLLRLTVPAMRGDDVKAVQERLIAEGFFVGPTGADGIFGQRTRDAVIAFQANKGMTADGVVRPQVYEALGIQCGKYEDPVGGEPPGEPPPPTAPFIPRCRLLRLTSPMLYGDDVRIVQQQLVIRGYSVGQTGADGWYGPNTRDAVVRFQQDKGLLVDGIVGPQTYRALGIICGTGPL